MERTNGTEGTSGTNGSAPDRLRIMLADDHPMFCEGLAAILQTIGTMELVGQAADGAAAVRLALDLQPDIVLMDVSMPGMNGIEATREIVRTSPHIGVLMLTMFDDDSSVFAAIRAGARGYVLKGARKEDIVRAIEAVATGEAIFSPGIARRMMFYFDRAAGAASGQSLFPKLTDREREVLAWIGGGSGNGDIARKLGVSLKTVRNHVSNILNKLQVTDRAQAVMLAKEAGLERPRPDRPG